MSFFSTRSPSLFFLIQFTLARAQRRQKPNPRELSFTYSPRRSSIWRLIPQLPSIMSSIFTFNPSPPKPASPWANNTPTHPTPSTTPRPATESPDLTTDDTPGHLRTNNNSGKIRNHFMEDSEREGIVTTNGETVKGLAAEPQMGATEYKLSLVRGGKSEARLDQLVTQLLWRLQQSSPCVASISRIQAAIADLSTTLGTTPTPLPPSPQKRSPHWFKNPKARSTRSELPMMANLSGCVRRNSKHLWILYA